MELDHDAAARWHARHVHTGLVEHLADAIAAVVALAFSARLEQRQALPVTLTADDTVSDRLGRGFGQFWLNRLGQYWLHMLGQFLGQSLGQSLGQFLGQFSGQ